MEHSDKKTINESSITYLKHGKSLGLKNSTKKKSQDLVIVYDQAVSQSVLSEQKATDET